MLYLKYKVEARINLHLKQPIIKTSDKLPTNELTCSYKIHQKKITYNDKQNNGDQTMI